MPIGMSALLLDGRVLGSAILDETRIKVETLAQRGIQPSVVFIRVGEDPASVVYVRMKDQTAAKLGIRATTLVLDKNISQEELVTTIQKLNSDPSVHGILVQAPLPKPISEQVIFSTVDPCKDVDGFHPVNVGKLMLGDPTGFRPCTPAGVHEILIRSNIPTAGAEVVILGRGNIVGKPMASILVQKAPHCDATITMLHSRSRDIRAHCLQADIIIAAMGSANFLKADMVKPGATVIDVGVNRVPDASSPKGSKLVGDVDFDAVKEIAGAITPNPGGVGPMTIAMLMSNTVKACEIAAGS